MNTDVRCVTSGQPGKLPSAHADSCPMIAWSKRCFCRPWTALAEYQSNGEMGYIRYKEEESPNIFGKVKIGGGWQMKTLCRILWVCLESLVLTVCGTSYTGSVGRRQILCHRHLSLRKAQGQSVGTVGIRSSMKWPSRWQRYWQIYRYAIPRGNQNPFTDVIPLDRTRLTRTQMTSARFKGKPSLALSTGLCLT